MRFADLHPDLPALAALCERYGVDRLELFGSFARGEAAADSDLDVMVTFRPGTVLGLRFIQLVQDLRDLLHREVDVVEREAVERSPNPSSRAEALRVVEPIHVATAA